MPTAEPNYYDSQASAAAELQIDVFLVKAAKRAGCTAFRSGRVYRAELVAWLKRNAPPVRASSTAGNGDEFRFCIPQSFQWNDKSDRRSLLIELPEFLHHAHSRGQLSTAEYVRIGDATVRLVINLATVWGAEIDVLGYFNGWVETKRRAAQAGPC